MSKQDDDWAAKALASLGNNNPVQPGAFGFSGYSSGLASLFQRPEVTGLYYNGTKVVLDGYTFNRCRFDNCTLEISTLNFSLVHCIIDNTTVIEYGAEVAKLIKLFNARFPWAYSSLPLFVPQKHADGTMSVVDYPV